MRLFCEIYVKDPKATRDFYHAVLGLIVTREEGHFIVMQQDEAKLLISPIEDLPQPLKFPHSEQERLGSRVEFCFETSDINAAYETALTSGYKIIEPLKDQPWGKTDFRVIDPDGAYVRITSPRLQPLVLS